MDQVHDILEAAELEERRVDCGQLLEIFSSLDETERRRFSWVAPTLSDLKWLKDILCCDSGQRVAKLIGIGCGSGFLERMVADFCDVPVVGVELKDSWWMSKFHPRIFVHMEFTQSPIERDFPLNDVFRGNNKALLFCYFNNAAAFNEYLNCFQPYMLILIGPKDNVGIHTDPMPLCPEFTGESRFSLLDCKYLEDDLNVIAVYKREE